MRIELVILGVILFVTGLCIFFQGYLTFDTIERTFKSGYYGETMPSFTINERFTEQIFMFIGSLIAIPGIVIFFAGLVTSLKKEYELETKKILNFNLNDTIRILSKEIKNNTIN